MYKINLDTDKIHRDPCANPTTTNVEKDNDDDDGEDDFTQADYYQLDCPRVYSHLSPLLVVLDFDHTLAVTDTEFVLERDLSGKFRSIYTRPFLYPFLDFIKSVNKNNVIILWTAGTKFYINYALLLLNIAHYFDHVLSREDCDRSKRDFGMKKSHQFLVEQFPQYRNMRSVIVDNYALHNSRNTGFSKVISIKPFNFSDIVRGLGAFEIPPVHICDVNAFMKSKGEDGFSKDYYFLLDDSHNPYYGDTALLNLIKYMNGEFFLGGCDEKAQEKEFVPEVNIGELYCIEENGKELSVSRKELPRLLPVSDFALGQPVFVFFTPAKTL